MMVSNAAPSNPTRAATAPDPEFIEAALIHGVLIRRLFAWIVDLILIGALASVLWTLGVVAGVLTFGITLPALGVLPVVPLLYHWITLASPMSASPGQALFGLVVRNDSDLGDVTAIQALVFTVLLYVTLAVGAFWVLVALFTSRHRCFHDMLAGVVVVRARALTRLHDAWNTGAGPATGRSRA